MNNYFAEIYNPHGGIRCLEKSGYIKKNFTIDPNGVIKLQFTNGDIYITHISNVIISAEAW